MGRVLQPPLSRRTFGSPWSGLRVPSGGLVRLVAAGPWLNDARIDMYLLQCTICFATFRRPCAMMAKPRNLLLRLNGELADVWEKPASWKELLVRIPTAAERLHALIGDPPQKIGVAQEIEKILKEEPTFDWASHVRNELEEEKGPLTEADIDEAVDLIRLAIGQNEAASSPIGSMGQGERLPPVSYPPPRLPDRSSSMN